MVGSMIFIVRNKTLTLTANLPIIASHLFALKYGFIDINHRRLNLFDTENARCELH